MKLFKKRLCLFLSFVLASQTILYANTNIRKPSFIDYQNMLKVKILSPLITNIEYKISNKDFKNTEEMNNLIILSTNLYKSMVKDFPKDISTTAYMTGLNSMSKNTTTNNNVAIKENIPSKTTSHKSSGVSSSSSNTTPVADTFSKKIILSGIDVINDEISMATTSDSVLKLNNMKNIFNELFDDCKNNNITFPREYTTDEKIEIITRLNNEVGKQRGSSLISSNINSWNTKIEDVNRYGEPLEPVGIYCAMVENPNQKGVYGVFCKLEYTSSSNCFFGGNIDSEFRVDDILMRKHSDNLGWDTTPNKVFGRLCEIEPLCFDGKLTTDSSINVDIRTNILGDYSVNLNKYNAIYTTLNQDRIDKCEEYLNRLIKKWEPVDFPVTTDSIITIN